ncbi:hypothetical protein JCM6882_004570 [Rhodosporidiobolus microsporus]
MSDPNRKKHARKLTGLFRRRTGESSAGPAPPEDEGNLSDVERRHEQNTHRNFTVAKGALERKRAELAAARQAVAHAGTTRPPMDPRPFQRHEEQCRAEVEHAETEFRGYKKNYLMVLIKEIDQEETNMRTASGAEAQQIQIRLQVKTDNLFRLAEDDLEERRRTQREKDQRTFSLYEHQDEANDMLASYGDSSAAGGMDDLVELGKRLLGEDQHTLRGLLFLENILTVILPHRRLAAEVAQRIRGLRAQIAQLQRAIAPKPAGHEQGAQWV